MDWDINIMNKFQVLLSQLFFWMSFGRQFLVAKMLFAVCLLEAFLTIRYQNGKFHWGSFKNYATLEGEQGVWV